MSLSPVFLLAAVAALIASAAAQGNDVDQGVQEAIGDNELADHPLYEFVYEVGPTTQGNARGFGHKESRDGSRTWGTYFQQLSDGRLQTVKYWVDQSGYHAEVEYAGVAIPWEGDAEAKRGRAAGRPQQAETTGDPGVVQALLESFPKESLQTKRSAKATGEVRDSISPVVHSQRPSERSSSPAVRQVLRPIPVDVYSRRSSERSSRNRSAQRRRSQSPPSNA